MERRERRAYEPPPWEPTAAQPTSPVSKAPEAEEVQDPEIGAMVAGLGSAASAEPEAPQPTQEPMAAYAAVKGRISYDSAKVDAMLLQLKVEEPGVVKQTSTIGMVSSAVLAAIGFVMLVWGLAATARTAQAGGEMSGYFGATIVIVFGLVFVGLAGWLLWRSLKQRGDV